jgi:hypothetical protein
MQGGRQLRRWGKAEGGAITTTTATADVDAAVDAMLLADVGDGPGITSRVLRHHDKIVRAGNYTASAPG